MSYTGQTHQIPCNAGGLNDTPNQELMDASAMVDGSKNINLTNGGRQKRGGTIKINSDPFGQTALSISAADHTANPDTITLNSSYGDRTAFFTATTVITIAGSTANDGQYTVGSSSFNGTNTILVLDEALTDSTGDGTAIQYNTPPEINGLYDFMPAGAAAHIVSSDDLGHLWDGASSIIHADFSVDRYTSFEQFNDTLYVCNGKDIPQTWDGSASSTSDIGVAGITAPTALTAATSGTGSGILLDAPANYYYKVTFVNAHGETAAGTASAVLATISTDDQVDLTEIPVGGSGVTARKIYRTEGGGATYKLLTTLSDNTTTTFTDNVADGSLGATAPSTSDASSLPTDWSGTNYPQQCIKHGRGNSQRMWYIGCPSTPYTVYVSPNNLPEDLDDASVATFKIDTGDGFGLTGAVEMNDKLFCFGKRRAYVIDDADTNTSNWGYVQAPWEGGVAHFRLIVKTPNDVLCMTDEGDIYSVNAAQQYGDYKQASVVRPSYIHKWIQDNVRLSYINRFHGIYDPVLRAVKYFIVRTGQTKVDTALVYFLDRGAKDGWMIHDNQTDQAGNYTNPSGYKACSSALIRVGAGQYQVYTGDFTGTVWSLENTAKSDNALAYYSGFKTPLNGLTDNRSQKNFKRGFLVIDPQGTEKITIIPTIDSNTMSKRSITAQTGVKNYEFKLGNNGKRIQYEIYNATAGEDFFISQILTDLKPLGNEPE